MAPNATKRFQGIGMQVVSCPICKSAQFENNAVFIPINAALAAHIKTYGSAIVEGICTGNNPFGVKHTIAYTIECPSPQQLLENMG